VQKGLCPPTHDFFSLKLSQFVLLMGVCCFSLGMDVQKALLYPLTIFSVSSSLSLYSAEGFLERNGRIAILERDSIIPSPRVYELWCTSDVL
jgi:hypothetical protein